MIVGGVVFLVASVVRCGRKVIQLRPNAAVVFAAIVEYLFHLLRFLGRLMFRVFWVNALQELMLFFGANGGVCWVAFRCGGS